MAQSNDRGTVVLLQITDLHLHAAPDSQMRGVTTQDTFLSVLDYSRKVPRWPPDAILVTGDIVQDGSQAGYKRFRETLQALNLPVLCVPGNHDDPVLMAGLLMSPPFQLCGEAKFGKWRILLLNTFQKENHAGALGFSGLTALVSSLKEFSDEHVLICMHHQPIPMGSAWLDRIGLQDAEPFLDIINRHNQVRGVVWGHVHQASDRDRNGVRFLSTPSTCSQFLPDSEFFTLDSRPPGLRWLALEPNGQITTEVNWVSSSNQI